MNTRLNLRAALAMALTLVLASSCSKDDGIPSDPQGTFTLNMMNTENGKTLLGNSDVYITDANNFRTTECRIADLGRVAGLGVNSTPRLTDLAMEIAISPKHAYQIFKENTLTYFPLAKTRAIHRDADYYQAYVVESISNDKGIVGAKVKFFLAHPDAGNLPQTDVIVANFQYQGETKEYTIPSGAEYLLAEYRDVNDVFSIEKRGNTLHIELLKDPNRVSGPWGYRNLLIRTGSVYTSVRLAIGM